MGWSEHDGLGSALDLACLTNLKEMKEMIMMSMKEVNLSHVAKGQFFVNGA